MASAAVGAEYGVTDKATIPMSYIISRVTGMADYLSPAKSLATEKGLAIQTISWEDCARSKGSVWGPCICDMTLQVNGTRMPVIREPNFTDKTWDIRLDKFPVSVGNHIAGGKTTSVSLADYLSDINKYSTADMLISHGTLLKEDETHCIVSTQCCFLPVEKGAETKFNVALYSYQSRKGDPAVLTIVCTSKGSSAQIIEGREQLLLFNNAGVKADFSAQRLTDNRAERGVKLTGEMTKEERQDNIIIIVQIPLKQKSSDVGIFDGFGMGGGWGAPAGALFGAPPGAAPTFAMDSSLDMFEDASDECALPKLQSSSAFVGMKSVSRSVESSSLKRKKKKKERADVEAAIVRISQRTTVTCTCGTELVETNASLAYGPGQSVNCDGCKRAVGSTETVYHCPKGRSPAHSGGYDLCLICAQKQLQFDELNGTGMTLTRDKRYPIRVTLQYYKSTANGVVDRPIMDAIYALLQSSKDKADFVGSLVTETDPDRPTEWVKKPVFDPVLFGGGPGSGAGSYDLVSKLLAESGCYEAYFAKFKEEEIDDETLQCFEAASDFKDVIPKTGPRMRFFAALRKYREASAPKKPERPEVDFMSGLF